MAGKKKYFNLSPSDILLRNMQQEINNQKKGKVAAEDYRKSLGNNLAKKYIRRRGI